MAGNPARGIGSSNRGDQPELLFQGGSPLLSQASFLVGSGGRGRPMGTKLHPLTFHSPQSGISLHPHSPLAVPGPLRTLEIWDTDISQEEQTGQAYSPPNAFFFSVPPRTSTLTSPGVARGIQSSKPYPNSSTWTTSWNGDPHALRRKPRWLPTHQERTPRLFGGGGSPSESISLSSVLSYRSKLRTLQTRVHFGSGEVVGRGQSAQVQHSFWTENSVHVSKSESSCPLRKKAERSRWEGSLRHGSEN